MKQDISRSTRPSTAGNNRRTKICAIVGLSVCLLALLFAGPASSQPSPPLQPPLGPGGYDYPHQGVTTLGPYYHPWHPDQENYKYYIFEPADPKPEFAPVVLFIHGYAALQPPAYSAWLGHMVRKGYTVVWVNYDTGLTAPWGYANYVEATWTDALKRLDTHWWESHVLPEKDENWEIKTAIVGHSAGAYLAAVIAARATDPNRGIPIPYALVCIEPGGLGLIPKEDFSRIDPSTKFVVLASDEDEIVCKSTAQYLWKNTPQIADQDKDFLFYRSDRHGEPEQIANHFFPNSSGYNDTAAVDARDFYITYKLSVGLLNCAFYGVHCDYALGQGSPEQVDMGVWSDGRPNLPLQWIEDPDGLETQCIDKFEDRPPWGAAEAQAADRFGTAAARRGASIGWLLPLAIFLLFGFFLFMRRGGRPFPGRRE